MKLRIKPLLLIALPVCASISTSFCASAQTLLADQPIATTTAAPGNMVLALSVEFPTAISYAYNTSNYGTYNPAIAYQGLFDPGRCYTYSVGTTATTGPASSQSGYFINTVAASATHTCSGIAAGGWSGSFLNWAGTQAIDNFRVVLTGGYRSIDTASQTILEKAWFPLAADQQPEGIGGAPDKTISSASTIGGVMPSGSAFTQLTTRVFAGQNLLYFTSTGSNLDGATATSATLYQGTTLTSSNAATIFAVPIRVQTCASATYLESNCKQYGTNYKPEGLIQQYANRIRFAVFGYVNDNNYGDTATNPNRLRDGGVLRAKMKFVGPTQPVPGMSPTTNTQAEWSSIDGTFAPPADPTKAVDINTNPAGPNTADAIATGYGAIDSGVINYLNKFGETAKFYKTYDPVSEMYYAAVRYLKNMGTVPEYSTNLTNKLVDGFPVINISKASPFTDSTDNPIIYSCQKNFILGIGDTNTGPDANLPGTTPTTLQANPQLNKGSVATIEPTKESSVTSDTSISDQPANGAYRATDYVGVLEKASPAASEPYTSVYLPSTAVSNQTGPGGQPNTYLMAGVAYDAHTRDLQPNNFKNSDGITKPVIQTASTYWLDVLESGFIPYNQFWLATKFGGFALPPNYVPYANSLAIDKQYWHTTTDTLTGIDNNTYLRPDNYYTANNPTVLTNGLKSAFASAASQLTASSTSFVTSTPQVQPYGNTSYAASFNAQDWSGSMTASSLSFDSTGAPTTTLVWNARDKLTAQAKNNGWTNRIIATSSGLSSYTAVGLLQAKGVPFEIPGSSSSGISAFEQTALLNTSILLSTSQNMLSYLRGDQTNEVNTTSNSGFYRPRTYTLGDIANSKVTPIAAPNATYSDSTNAGYSSFKATYATRPTVVYVGANDGMMHAFDGSTTNSTAGNELFAYVPSFNIYGPNGTPSMNGMASLANTAFIHHAMVDATPAVYDIDFGKAGTATAGAVNWHSVLIGGLGKGGKGFYAIDVTNPASVTNESILAGNVLWEFSDTRMGYSYGPPIVAKTKKYGWVVMLTSGYNNADGIGYLFILNPQTGALLEAISTGTGSTTNPAGLAYASAYIQDYSDFTTDSVYAGDLLGNVWRFDLTGTSGNYQSSTNPLKLASLTNAAGTAEPVTTRPLIEIDPQTLVRYVAVGTGKLLDSTDAVTTSLQSFYAIKDGNRTAFSTSTTTVTRSMLTNNSSSLLTGISSTSGAGWYIDLTNPDTTFNGGALKVLIDPTANSGAIAFAASQLGGLPCTTNSRSQVYAVSLSTGKTVLVQGTTALAYQSITSGSVTELSFVNVGGRIRLEAGSDNTTVTNITGNFDSLTGSKRLNWREIPLTN